MSDRTCCVGGCKLEARHVRTFTVGWDHGEIETTSGFCCGHFDHWNTEAQPFIDLKVVGVMRVAGTEGKP